MASEFDQLEPRRRARSTDLGYPSDLPGISSRGAPPPDLPPTLNMPMKSASQMAAPRTQTPSGPNAEDSGNAAVQFPGPAKQELPPGYSYSNETKGLPPGYSYSEGGGEGSKISRFLQNVTPRGPISGIIGLARTAGQAAQGQRPDLMTNPENAIPEAVQGAAFGPGARSLVRPIESNAAQLRGLSGRGPVPEPPPAGPPAVPPEPLQLTYQPPRKTLADVQLETKRMAQRLRDTGQMPPESTGPPIELGGSVTPPPPPSPLLPPQLVREFGAVRKGVELRDRLNPESAPNVSAREQAVQAAIRPHLNSIEAVTRRTQAPIAALEAAVPSLSDALSTPARAASVANWVRIYERAARANFSPQAKASLGLATKNLNNNLGTDLTLKDVLSGE